ncbi:MAG TPA: MipA/OmpV family protein, partial [Nitrospirota bacterium]
MENKVFKSLGPVLTAAALFAFQPAYADTTTALTEVYTDTGVPASREGQPPEGLHGIIGAGVFNGERILGDARRRSVLLPIILMTYQDRAYWSIGGGGFWLYHSDDRSLKLGAGLKLHPGYRPDGDQELAGMEKRRSSIDGYLNAVWQNPVVDFGITYYRDIGRVSRGDAATIRVSHNFQITPDIRLTPSVGLEWESAKLVNYYYGVKPSEAQPGRPAYTGRKTINYGVGMTGAYRLSRSWCL